MVIGSCLHEVFFGPWKMEIDWFQCGELGYFLTIIAWLNFHTIAVIVFAKGYLISY